MIEIVTSTKGMTKEEWLNYRNKGIGGSDVSVICGANKYNSTGIYALDSALYSSFNWWQ